jgi:hypothetical protein
MNTCQLVGTFAPQCDSEWRGLLSCGDGADFYCNDAGEARAEGCQVEQGVAALCLLAAGLS